MTQEKFKAIGETYNRAWELQRKSSDMKAIIEKIKASGVNMRAVGMEWVDINGLIGCDISEKINEMVLQSLQATHDQIVDEFDKL